MSDRSFGDYTNRNVVKNPLLSTAVIGLSIEDLTQNAVLLPAVPSQGVIATQDEQHETQTRPLRHPEHDVTKISSGDINSNPQNPQTHITNPLNDNKNTQNDKINEASSKSTLSKASVKSTDDFDVNEYFARLQGTRYVSAPLNSNVTDQNANLQVEENLEEINLNESNEPEKPHALETQSLTADIAQNFSQLPNVLPHVASAVFSSFSNMLSLKSREVIPDEQKVQYNEQKAQYNEQKAQYNEQKVQHDEQNRVMNMPLGVPEAPIAVAPPPLREPPTTGTTSNYRITTKKKTYAQVPGLSSGDHQHKQTFNPGPFTQNAPSYFIPDNVSNTPYSRTTENVSIGFDTKPSTTDQSNKDYIYGLNFSREIDKHQVVSFHEINQGSANADDTKDRFHVFNPTVSTPTAYQAELNTKITEQGNADNSHVSTHMTAEAKESFNMFHPTASVPLPTVEGKNENDQTRESNQIESKESYDIFYPISPVSIQAKNTVEINANSQSIPNLKPSVSKSVKQSDFMSQIKPNIEMQRDISSQTSMANQAKLLPQSWIPNPFDFVPSAPQGSVIPPPPMFSNMQRKDSQTTVGKSVLPPSVARRISANQPIIKPRALPTMVPQDNIFVPTIPYEPETHVQQNFGMLTSSNLQNVGQGSSTSKSEINLQAQTLPRDNTQSQFQMPSLNQSIVSSLSNSSVPLISSNNTTLPEFTSMPLNSRGSLSLPSITNMPPIDTKEETATENLPPQHPQQTSLAFSNDSKTDNIAKSSGPFQECSLPPKHEIKTPSTEQMIVSPPMFFNTASLNQANEPKSESDIHKYQGAEPQDAFQRSGLFTMNAQPEPPKVIADPPKLTGNLNYRMNKKKRQYYSGPITGVGNISNNVKPVLDPVGPNSFQGAIFNPDHNLQPMHQNLTEERALIIGQEMPKPPTTQSSFQGAIFTPDLNIQPLAQNSAIDYNVPSEYVITHPFDLNKPPASSYPLDLSEQEDRKPLADNYINTAFDLSRPVTERFEDINKDTKGFGIIGSLKSKLSSIDINKIQNTVTTFFDPAYNDTKLQENNQEVTSQYHGTYRNFPPTESTNLEVFIPSANKEPYDAYVSNQYQMDYSQTEIQPQYYKTQEYFIDTQSNPNDKYAAWNTYQPQPNDTNQNILSNKSFEDLHSYTTIFSSSSANKITEEKSLKEKENEKFLSISNMPGSLPKTLGPIKNEDEESSLLDRKDIISGDIGSLRESSEDSKFFNTGNSSLKTFFDYSKQEPQSVFETINYNKNDIENTNTECGQTTVADAFKSTLDQPKVEPKCTKSLNEEPPETSKIFSNISAKDFFETQQFQENLIVSKPENNNETDILSKSFFDNLMLNKNDRGDMESNNDLEKVFSKQKETDVDTSKELLTTVVLPVLKDLSEDLVPPQFLDDSGKGEQIASPSCENRSTDDSEGVSKLSQPAYSFFDLSEADNTSYRNMIGVEETMKKLALIDSPEHVHNNSSLSDFYANNEPIELIKDTRELNICETCREVNKPEEKDVDDLTSQLIENITAPIQLANPVGYPFANSNLVLDKSEISHTAEEIIESMQLPPPVELIDDISVSTNLNYGWSTNAPHSTNVVVDHDYNIPPDPISIGFFQDKTSLFENVPTNASDEIKALSLSQEDSILPRSISIPTAPPEEDTKSDESGLDVHSIEQDAKKDFPIYEEFIIEPSETDDDKIEYKERERSSDDPIPEADTFTNRVERYKKMEVHPEPINSFELNKDSIPFELPTSTSPALTIASYFDTGNYAVENHYRNSLTSPTSVTSFAVNSTASMRIPPGFEDSYKRSLILAASIPPGFEDQNATRIPDTSTQTPGTATVTFNQNIHYPPHTVTQILNLAKMTCSQNRMKNLKFDDPEVNTMMRELEDVLSPASHERLSAFSNIGESNKDTEDKAQMKPEASPSSEQEDQKKEEPKQESLPDPTNFFTSNVTESNEDSDVYSNFSRLSSYFTSPPKPDHSKSFFELSQSQDHYRHKPKNETADSIEKNVKHFFETTELNASVNVKSSSIPENLIANKNLVSELTSIHNFTPKDDIVRTVNYFIVENAKEISIGEPKVSSHLNEKDRVEHNYRELKNNQLGDVDESSLNFEEIITKCKYCCDATKNFTRLNFERVDFDNSKVRKSMDNKCDTKKEGDSNMDVKKDSASKKGLTVNFLEQTFQEDNSDKIVTMAENRSDYSPVKHHWFYRVDLEDKSIWRGFSAGDSKALEDAYNSPDLNENTVVATDGGRYDVNVMARLRTAVYWKDKPSNVMRCSWFYKGTAVPRYVPYTESIAEKLEEMYRHSVTTGEWHRRLSLPNDEMVVMHGPAVMVHFLQTSADAFTSTPLSVFGKSVYRNPPKISVAENQSQRIDHLVFMVHGAGEWRHQKQKIQSQRQRVVRGFVESEIEDTEPSSIDHLLLMCHGVGSACDMRFRSVEEVVDDFRSASLQLVQSHYKNSYDSGLVGRVEVLPISWHSSLHSGETGVDTRLAAVTLESIPRLRTFTNDTLLDVLFYTSPVFCQTIIDTVCGELNRIYALFKKRNPNYRGGVSLGGHSLGSVILYDLLCHQMPLDAERVATDKQYVRGTAGTGQPSVHYPRLEFRPDALYALGSPIAIFECIRGVQTLGLEFCLPTCRNFFNIFHPYDPIAYRIEPMVNPLLRDVKPSLIPHHKGRKRMHLELKDTMARVGADIKQKLIESIKSTWSSMWKTQPPPDTQLEKVVEEEMEKEQLNADSKEEQAQEHEITPEMLGKLNGGRRIDHVLQEAPFEMINEYLFAMSSHVCYWESEDTMLVMLREIYNALGVTPDCSVPQNTMTVQRTRLTEDAVGVDFPDSPSTSRGGS